MNRYAALGLAVAAARGRSIIVLTHRMREARAAFDLVVAESDAPDLARVYRANGRERIDFAPGGCIYFKTGAASCRGLQVDDIYLDARVEATPDLLAELRPCLNPTGGGMIHRQ